MDPITLESLDTEFYTKKRIQDENVRHGLARCDNESKDKSVRKLRNRLIHQETLNLKPRTHFNSRMMFTKEDILRTVSFSKFAGILDDCTEFHGPLGKEHYKLLSYFSTLFNDSVILDIGTHRGSSALALSYNPTNTIHTFDICDKVTNAAIRATPTIVFHTEDNLFEAAEQPKWEALVHQAPFIFLDVDPHNGHMETQFYNWLKRIGYKGFVVCDDIWYFKEMRDNFWYSIPHEERYDLTDMGHWSGTGIFTFNRDITFPKADNSDWTLVTAYFNLTKCVDASTEINKRDKTHYMNSAISTMALPYNLVVYCEADTLDELKSLRPAYLADKTKYIVCEFDAFRFTKNSGPLSESFADYRLQIAKNRVEHPYEFDNRNTPSYYLFCMARYAMLKEQILANPFKSTHYGWVNMCIERMGYKNVQRLDEALAVHRDKFSTCYIDYVPEPLVRNTAEYFKRGRCGMCSGFFTGNAVYMYLVCDLIEDKFLQYLKEGYGHADEQLYSPVYFENKALFEHYYGDYQQMITNYKYIYEAAEPPVYNFIRNSYRNGDKEKCREACNFVLTSVRLGTCSCDPSLLAEAQNTLAVCQS